MKQRDKISAMLRDQGLDDVADIYDRETKIDKEKQDAETQTKCIYSAVFWVAFTSLVFVGCFYYFSTSSDNTWLSGLYSALGGK